MGAHTGYQYTREAQAEVLAVHLYSTATKAGVVITRRWVDGQLAALRSHPPHCRCSAPCGLSGAASPSKGRLDPVGLAGVDSAGAAPRPTLICAKALMIIS